MKIGLYLKSTPLKLTTHPTSLKMYFCRGGLIWPLRAGANGQFWADDQKNGTGPHQ